MKAEGTQISSLLWRQAKTSQGTKNFSHMGERWLTSSKAVTSSTKSGWSTAIKTLAKFLIDTVQDKPVPGSADYLIYAEYAAAVKDLHELANRFGKLMGPKKNAEAITNKRIRAAIDVKERDVHQKRIADMLECEFYRDLLNRASKVHNKTYCFWFWLPGVWCVWCV